MLGTVSIAPTITYQTGMAALWRALWQVLPLWLLLAGLLLIAGLRLARWARSRRRGRITERDMAWLRSRDPAWPRRD